MASDAVETIRDGLAAWSRGDLDGMLVGVDPEIEFVSSGLFPGVARVYQGHDGFKRFTSAFRDLWERIAVDVEHIVPGDGSSYAALGRFAATGRSGIAVERPIAFVFRTNDATVMRIEAYGSWEEALDGAGVPAADRRAYR